MAKYAENTTVSSAQSRAEIEHTLERYGAQGFAYGWQDGKAMVGFSMNGRHVRFTLQLPDRDAPEITHTPGRNRERTPEKQLAEYERATRQRWRALALVIKAKLEAVEAGITVFDEEFLAHIVLPDGKTTGEHVIPEVSKALTSGKACLLLPRFESEKK